MNKSVAWIIALALLALVLYAIASGLPKDVLDPFTPPQPQPH